MPNQIEEPPVYITTNKKLVEVVDTVVDMAANMVEAAGNLVKVIVSNKNLNNFVMSMELKVEIENIFSLNMIIYMVHSAKHLTRLKMALKVY